jgi:protein TonB
MKRLVSILLLIACFATSFVQAQDTIPNHLEDDDVIINIKRYVCMPEYPRGEQALVEYLSANVHYPEQAVKDSIDGRVVVGFSLQADLSVTNVVVLQSSGSALLDEEAIRVVRSMPKWECKSEPCYIDVKYTVPVNFKFE